MFLDDIQMPRQHVIRGAGVVLAGGTLAACSGGEKSAPATEATTSAQKPTVAPAGEVITKTSDVPVGSGVIANDVVVTQPSAGVFKGFSTTCPHRGCAVNKVADGTIDCPCHGSKFNLDGTVAKGPATEPLEAKAVLVQGDSIVRA